jgi:hypothetical protein
MAACEEASKLDGIVHLTGKSMGVGIRTSKKRIETNGGSVGTPSKITRVHALKRWQVGIDR